MVFFYLILQLARMGGFLLPLPLSRLLQYIILILLDYVTEVPPTITGMSGI